MIAVKRALLSCSDKTGLERFAKGLAELGVELIASGGTAEALKKQGLAVRTVESFAGISEQLDGRVKTLHPKIHGGILAKRDDPAHVASVGPESMIDLVVVNLYPFERTVQGPKTSLAEAIEQIDIGGVALLRAAAKNFAHVAVVSDPAQYDEVLQALRAGHGALPETLTRSLALAAFTRTSRYDGAISAYLAATHGASAPAEDEVTLTLRKRQALRYGENPHQQGAWYLEPSEPPSGFGTLIQLQGKELSYNNFLDMDAALRCLADFQEPTAVIIKHSSQCGIATAASIQQAYARAYACDAESAFGGIVGVNRAVDAALAEQLAATFLEVVLAPSVDEAARSRLAKKPNLRVVTIDWSALRQPAREWRHLLGSWLAQEPDARVTESEAPRVVTKRAPTPQEQADLAFAWKAAKHVKSNGIVLAAGGATVGIGQGQPSRVGSVRLALEKAGVKSRGTVAASDGFFPFADSLTLLAQAGVTAVIQPGGSIRDAEVIAAADAANVAMVISGVRHFRH